MSEVKASAYDLIGGEAVLRQLVDRFYQLMDTDPKATGIRAIHQPDLSEAKQKLFLFLSGWMGGPPLYVEKYGHPRLRGRHLPFRIGEAERDQWMGCMTQAMQDVGIDEAVQTRLHKALWDLADFMRNQPEH